MKDKLLFKIFLPVFNGEKYIQHTVQSIIYQSYFNWELHILNNGSTDSTLSILSNIKFDERLFIHNYSSHVSIEKNWGRVFDLVVNMKDIFYMSLIGHDDIYYQDFLQEMYAIIQLNPNIKVYQSHFNIINNNGILIRPSLPIPAFENKIDFFMSRLFKIRDSLFF